MQVKEEVKLIREIMFLETKMVQHKDHWCAPNIESFQNSNPDMIEENFSVRKNSILSITLGSKKK